MSEPLKWQSCMPDCMMPDGDEACKGFTMATDELATTRAELAATKAALADAKKSSEVWQCLAEAGRSRADGAEKRAEAAEAQVTALRAALGDAEQLLKEYDEAMASQEKNMSDIKLIVMANYGDLCATRLRRIVKTSAALDTKGGEA